MAISLTMALVLIGVVAALVAWQMISVAKRHRDAMRLWLPLRAPGIPDGMRYKAVNGVPVDEPRLVQAVLKAMQCIATATGWEYDRLHLIARGVFIEIQATESWDTFTGAKVGGQTFVDQHLVVVGPSFSALAHELGHVFEERITNRIDYQHATWGTNGMWNADRCYRLTLPAAEGV